MKNIIIKSEATLYENISELPPQTAALLEKAYEAARDAYAPYSRFHVGVTLLFEDGTTLNGSNQENEAYPSGLCAERTALFAAGAIHKGLKIKSMAIAAIAEDYNIEDPVSPCGSCLQVILESERKQDMPIEIILGSKSGKTLVLSGVKNLMPFQFKLKAV